MGLGFKITRRHYDILIKQAQTNYPQECGGFLGGQDNVIKAILPTFNQHLYNKTDTYGITGEDIERAHQFFQKHDLEYIGIYHTHPKAPAIPSKEDLSHFQKHLFIISLLDIENPDFAVYEVDGLAYERVPLMISDSPIDVINIQGKPGEGLKDGEIGDIHQENERLNSMVNRYLSGDSIQYPSLPKKNKGVDGSTGFETIA